MPAQTHGSGAGGHTARPASDERPERISRRWRMLACAVILIGLAASLTAALMWRSSVNARNAQNFQTGAANVSGTLDTLIRRDTDFVRSVRAVIDARAAPQRKRVQALGDAARRPPGTARQPRRAARALRAGRAARALSGAARRRPGVPRARRRPHRNRRPERARALLPAVRWQRADRAERRSRADARGRLVRSDVIDRRLPPGRDDARAVHTRDHRKRSSSPPTPRGPPGSPR